MTENPDILDCFAILRLNLVNIKNINLFKYNSYEENLLFFDLYASFLVAMLFSLVAFAYDVEADGIYYNFDYENKTAEVTYQYESSSIDNYQGVENVIIPSTFSYNGNTYDVTSIGTSAFSYCSSLKSITIPSSITSIEMNTFTLCS